MWIREPLASDLPRLCAEMRAADAAEIYALRDHADPHRLAGEIFLALPQALAAFVAGVDGEPVAIAFCAVWPKGPCRVLGEAALFATADFPRVGQPFIRHIRKSFIGSVLASGVRRVECRSASGYRASHRLIRALGAKHEATLKDFGPDGMSYELFAWCVSDICRGGEARARVLAKN